MVQAGGGGWCARDVLAACAAGADIRTTNSGSRIRIMQRYALRTRRLHDRSDGSRGDVNECNDDARSPGYAAPSVATLAV